MIVDDHVMVRQVLRALLDTVPGLEVVAEAQNGQVAIEKVQKHCPHVVLMDIFMPVLDGIKATRHIKRLKPGTKIIALTNYEDENFTQEMMNAGASDYLLKSAGKKELVDSIRRATQTEDAAI